MHSASEGLVVIAGGLGIERQRSVCCGERQDDPSAMLGRGESGPVRQECV